MSEFDIKFPEHKRFNIGDRVIAHPDSNTAKDTKYLQALRDAKTPYLTVIGLKENWLMFNEHSMKITSYSSTDTNSWNPRFWLLYKEPYKPLNEDLFTL